MSKMSKRGNCVKSIKMNMIKMMIIKVSCHTDDILHHIGVKLHYLGVMLHHLRVMLH
jgi:hypothetical protein